MNSINQSFTVERDGRFLWNVG